ncbi:formylmethanofuran dehydrogenase subunit C [Tundrisphaera lichenicola]|uniref:formylmethanofuran dehydrogenase subunit C n=1 Tax=Tundrisphaera lichenicola TaxID=2029860 RepID=UPI003EBD323A
MPLVLRWKGPTGRPVDGDDLRPETLAGPASEASRLLVPSGNESAELGDLFAIEGDGSDGHLIFEGDLRAVRGLASGMTSGRVEIRGDVGPRLALGMLGGSVDVSGSVGDRAGAEIRGGLLRIRGDAGHLLGGALPGSRLGMRDGVILVEGDAGRDCGLAMRRGLIAVGGRLGEGAGRGMVAGSIFGFGPIDRSAGIGMKRGTLALLGSTGPELLPTFEPSGHLRPHFLAIYLGELRKLGFPVPNAGISPNILRYNGDRVVGGIGEILVAVD